MRMSISGSLHWSPWNDTAPERSPAEVSHLCTLDVLKPFPKGDSKAHVHWRYTFSMFLDLWLLEQVRQFVLNHYHAVVQGSLHDGNMLLGCLRAC